MRSKFISVTPFFPLYARSKKQVNSRKKFRKMQAFSGRLQGGACTRFARTLTTLRREKSDVHAATLFRLHFIPAAELPELCETFYTLFSSSATAWAAIPSPVPVNPSPSSVVAFTETSPASMPQAAASFSRISWNCA